MVWREQYDTHTNSNDKSPQHQLSTKSQFSKKAKEHIEHLQNAIHHHHADHAPSKALKHSGDHEKIPDHVGDASVIIENQLACTMWFSIYDSTNKKEITNNMVYLVIFFPFLSLIFFLFPFFLFCRLWIKVLRSIYITLLMITISLTWLSKLINMSGHSVLPSTTL